ncbi:glycosyltransferase family 4 protein [Macrococcoides canis]|uniref:glycosyltransferase family 4 protein n=1 Tax=Macrococcoides canis TaxID=1855823 RepID=UPI00207D1AC8|nr:glycosyltransferase family 4 protein [Macrococcus canis]MCO4096703.1 glycosyltransferase family 4 protein [Macrococcus canis]UTH10027.1 glycosyltransferase family 4 protein [Macrococcus canis]
MNILLIATFSGISGATKSLISVAKGLKERGHNVTVFTGTKGELQDILKKNDIQYIYSRSFVWVKPEEQKFTSIDKLKNSIKKIKNLHTEFFIYRFIKKENIDIVHINALTANWGAKATLLSKSKLIWHIREMLPIGINKEFIDKENSFKLINKANNAIAISNAVYDYYKDDLNNMVMIYNAIDTDIKVARKPILSDDVIKLTFIGRIVPGKGLIELINACRILKQKEINFKLEIYGSGDERYIDQLKKLANQYSLNRNIYFKGFTNNINQIWQNSDIALVCTKAEAFGRVTIEAMVNQTLVIGANTGGTIELIGNNRGLLYEQGNSDDLAQKIIVAINNKDMSREMVESAYEYVKQNFHIDILLDNIEKVYSKKS